MANTCKTMNARQKLAKARVDFLNSKTKKSGKNIQLEFKYFELEDIVPVAIRIFEQVGLITNTIFDGQHATMTVYNTDDLDEPGIMFMLPYKEAEQIVSKAGKTVTNAMQALGSSTTYLRRYLWMMVLDVTEPDEIDGTLDVDKSEAPSAPATPVERKEIKEKLTAEDGNATEAEIAELKQVMKKLIELDDTKEDFVQQIALNTEGLTKIASSTCKELIKNIEELIDEL